MADFSKAGQLEATLDPQQPIQAPSERLGALYGIGRQLLEQRGPREIFQTIQNAIVEHLAPEHVCVLARHDQDGYRAVVPAHNLDLSVPEARWPISRTVLRRAQESGLAVLASDVQGDETFERVGSIQKLKIQSVMCVPLGRPVEGMIYVDHRAKTRSFAKDDLEFLTAIALYASLVLRHARDYVRATTALQQSDERAEFLRGELLRHEIVGRSPGLVAAYDSIRRFAQAGARVLLRGETGTGKELFARAYAASSERHRRAYVPVPVPALASGLIESELFGHVKGAFTEASRDKKGRLEMADGGVLFLDEVGDIEPAVQPKLLRFLDSGELFRVGDTAPRRIDCMVVSATNRDIEKAIEAGRFRSDLLARLGQVVRIPPLRERPDDIPPLVDHFLARHPGEPKRFTGETLEIMQRYTWPLNVRELQQVVERAVCLTDHDEIRPEDLPTELLKHEPGPSLAATQATGPPGPLHDVVDAVEREHILRTLEFTKGNRRRAIELLKVSHDTFYKRLEEYGVHKRKR